MVPSVAIDNGNRVFLDQTSFHPLNLRPGFPTGNGWCPFRVGEVLLLQVSQTVAASAVMQTLY